MNDSKQSQPDLKPVNNVEEKCVHRCNLYPQCPCGAFDTKHGIVDTKKADGCMTKLVAIMIWAIVVGGIWLAITYACGV